MVDCKKAAAAAAWLETDKKSAKCLVYGRGPVGLLQPVIVGGTIEPRDRLSQCDMHGVQSNLL